MVDPASGQTTSKGNAVIGTGPGDPQVVVAANGGSDLIYLPGANAAALAPKIVRFLAHQDYVSGLFADDRFGAIPGALKISNIYLKGTAVTPTPAIVVNFKSFTTGCERPTLCTAEIADTVLQQGQGMHGSFSRADTFNFMAAIGPDFKAAFVDPAPVSNADVGATMASLLGLKIAPKGKLLGRVFSEAETGGKVPMFMKRTIASAPQDGIATMLRIQDLGTYQYFDAAGFAGRSVGL